MPQVLSADRFAPPGTQYVPRPLKITDQGNGSGKRGNIQEIYKKFARP